MPGYYLEWSLLYTIWKLMFSLLKIAGYTMTINFCLKLVKASVVLIIRFSPSVRGILSRKMLAVGVPWDFQTVLIDSIYCLLYRSMSLMDVWFMARCILFRILGIPFLTTSVRSGLTVDLNRQKLVIMIVCLKSRTSDQTFGSHDLQDKAAKLESFFWITTLSVAGILNQCVLSWKSYNYEEVLCLIADSGILSSAVSDVPYCRKQELAILSETRSLVSLEHGVILLCKKLQNCERIRSQNREKKSNTQSWRCKFYRCEVNLLWKLYMRRT